MCPTTVPPQKIENAPLTECTSGQWVTNNVVTDGTAIEDRSCSRLTECGVDEWDTNNVMDDGTSLEDRQCRAHTVCRDGQVELIPATPISDRVCGLLADAVLEHLTADGGDNENAHDGGGMSDEVDGGLMGIIPLEVFQWERCGFHAYESLNHGCLNNLAFEATVTANSMGHQSFRLVDEDLTSRWLAGVTNETTEVVIDLAKVKMRRKFGCEAPRTIWGQGILKCINL